MLFQRAPTKSSPPTGSGLITGKFPGGQGHIKGGDLRAALVDFQALDVVF